MIVVAQMEVVDSALSMEPDCLVLSISAELFWDGYSAAKKLKRDLEDYTKLDVSMGSDAAEAALGLYGIKRIGVITPYFPVGDQNVVRFFEEGGLNVVKVIGLKCESPVAIAHVSEARLREAIQAVNSPEVEEIMQVGTNLAMARLAPQAETWLGKPVIATQHGHLPPRPAGERYQRQDVWMGTASGGSLKTPLAWHGLV